MDTTRSQSFETARCNLGDPILTHTRMDPFGLPKMCWDNGHQTHAETSAKHEESKGVQMLFPRKCCQINSLMYLHFGMEMGCCLDVFDCTWPVLLEREFLSALTRLAFLLLFASMRQLGSSIVFDCEVVETLLLSRLISISSSLLHPLWWWRGRPDL